MKKIIFILLIVTVRANTVYTQCPARAYTPEWDTGGNIPILS